MNIRFLFYLNFTFFSFSIIRYFMGQKSCVIFCRCGANIISEDKFIKISEGLNNLDIHVYELHDLCAFSLSGHNVLKQIGAEFDHKIILACYPRAVENMLKQAGLDLGSMDILNFRELTPEDIFSQLTYPTSDCGRKGILSGTGY
jgi:hypothetical protein